MQPAIETIGLGKSYGGVPVLKAVDLCVPRGEVFALLGPNGSGKTTTVRILCTLLRADHGTARVAGLDVTTQYHAVRRRISLAGQHTALDDRQTGAENLRMMARLAGLSRADAGRRADRLLARFDLSGAADRYVVTYSGGMRRRLDLAAALVAESEVVFLDEPTTGLDPRSRQELWQVVADLAGDGVTVLLTTQYLEEADRLADRIALLDGGRVVAEGTAAELKRRVGDERLLLTMTDPASHAEARRRLGDRVTADEPQRLTLAVATDGSAPQLRRLLDEADPQGRGISRFEVRAATLDDVFLALTGVTHRETETADV